MKKIIYGLIVFSIVITSGIFVSAEEISEQNTNNPDILYELAQSEIDELQSAYLKEHNILSELDLSEDQITDLLDKKEIIKNKYLSNIFEEKEEEDRSIQPIAAEWNLSVGNILTTRTSRYGGFVGHAAMIVTSDGSTLEAVSPGHKSKIIPQGAARMKASPNKTTEFVHNELTNAGRGRIWYNAGSYTGIDYSLGGGSNGDNCVTLVSRALRVLGGVPVWSTVSVQSLAGEAHMRVVKKFNGGY